MLIPRHITKTIDTFLKRKEFLALIGPRQSGKTTILEIIRSHLVKNKKFPKDRIHIVTFEDIKLLKEFNADPVAFARSYVGGTSSGKRASTCLMLDEFQYAEDGGKKLKLVYDTLKDIKIIITGSSSLDIKAQVGKYMVGRILSFRVLPFDFGEFLTAKNRRLAAVYDERSALLSKWLAGDGTTPKFKPGRDAFAAEMTDLFDDYCVWGGYPAVVLSRASGERRKVLNDIYSNYILKDIKGLLEIATDKNLFTLAQYLASQSGGIVVYQNLSQAAALDFRQMKSHLNILKETFVCEEVRPFCANRQKELSKNPKIYFYDTGFRNGLLENMASLRMRPDAGALVENAVFVRLNGIRGDSGKINFWRTKAGAEVDFVFQSEGGTFPIEIKYSPFETPKISRSFTSFTDDYGPRRGLVLTKDYWGQTSKGKTDVLFAPVYYL